MVGDRHAGGGRLSGQRCGAGAVDRGHIAAEILVRHPVGLAELISAPARRRRLPTLAESAVDGACRDADPGGRLLDVGVTEVPCGTQHKEAIHHATSFLRGHSGRARSGPPRGYRPDPYARR
jgi:hypothetical protein